MAEFYPFFWFSFDFKDRYSNSHVFRDREYLSTTKTGIPIIDLVLLRLRTDFKNEYEQRKNRELIRSGKTPLPEDLRPGGARKPDAIGIAIDSTRQAVICELLEVTTRKQASSTMREDIQDKLDILNGKVKDGIDSDLRLLAEKRDLPVREFQAYGSPYIPGPAARQICIFPKIPENASSALSFEWFCYWPTCERRPCPWSSQVFLQNEDESSPARGLILYEIHTTPDPALVKQVELVWRRFKRWCEQNAAAGPTLDLIPAAAGRYWKETPSDLNLILSYAAAGLAALLVVTAAVYIVAPVLIGGGAFVAGAETTIALANAARAMPQVMSTAYAMVSAAFAVRGVDPPDLFAPIR